MLHITSLIAVYVVVALYAVAGVLVLTTGRVAPWWRGDVLRPRRWGSGALLFAAGMGLCRYGSAVRGLTAVDVVFTVGLALMVSGALLQFRAQHVGRTPA
ncbi:hypothetical protein ACWEWI_22400 [Streptomyces sp. NPDC003753]|uniref:hypothetical protein n=1 Tax=unclassified Streptomyces TaxID=2593676 RepID=UPI00190329CD|nr:hypothetical protein [Streptomyces sp. Y2F8-2]GHK00789.1 hypothetical protein SY2F82_25860 [Streptomyces sp. Y2F8-2]